MSMTGEFQRITYWQLEELLEQVRDGPEAFADYLYPETRRFDPPDPKLSIAKSWHSIHFLLNANPSKITYVAGRAVLGGHEVRAEMAYSPVRYMTPSEVKEVAEALQNITEEDFKLRFDPAVFQEAQIYPSGTWIGSNSLPWLWERFEELRNFYEEGAKCGDALLLQVS